MKNNQPNSEIIIYQTDDGTPKLEVRIEDETIWLTQDQMTSLFDKAKSTINEHIKNIFTEGELDEKVVVRKFRTTTKHGAIEGKTQTIEVNLYNLDVIISVGYRVKSIRGTQFRQWATARLREYIVKGFTMDDERLKNLGGGGYWKELLARVRDIRASEKVFYRQILDIYATSIDYDAHAETTFAFFKKVQNKVHYAVHGHTAAEVIYERANAEKDFMGLTTFSGSKPQLKDVTVAKNYLDEKELRALGQIVSGYLDFAERQAERKIAMTMKDWAQHLDSILTATGENILQNAGSVSHEQAVEKAQSEYGKYQAKTLSPVEEAYLENLKVLEKKVEKKVKSEKPKKRK
ncbi:MAG: virulence RhuM family protein [Candidatus Desantisbacteria bacterium]